MKNWGAALLLALVCVAASLSAVTTLLVLSSVVLPVDKWLAATAQPLRKRWRLTRKRLWRRVDAALRGDAWRVQSGNHHSDAALDELEWPPGESDTDEDDDCVRWISDWKHGRVCVISR